MEGCWCSQDKLSHANVQHFTICTFHSIAARCRKASLEYWKGLVWKSWRCTWLSAYTQSRKIWPKLHPKPIFHITPTINLCHALYRFDTNVQIWCYYAMHLITSVITLPHLPTEYQLPNRSLQGSQLAQPDTPKLSHPDWYSQSPDSGVGHHIAPKLHHLTTKILQISNFMCQLPKSFSGLSGPKRVCQCTFSPKKSAHLHSKINRIFSDAYEAFRDAMPLRWRCVNRGVIASIIIFGTPLSYWYSAFLSQLECRWATATHHDKDMLNVKCTCVLAHTRMVQVPSPL